MLDMVCYAGEEQIKKCINYVNVLIKLQQDIY